MTKRVDAERVPTDADADGGGGGFRLLSGSSRIRDVVVSFFVAVGTVIVGVSDRMEGLAERVYYR